MAASNVIGGNNITDKYFNSDDYRPRMNENNFNWILVRKKGFQRQSNHPENFQSRESPSNSEIITIKRNGGEYKNW